MTSLATSQSWNSVPSSGGTVGTHLGPFPFRPFLETVWHYRTESKAELVATSDGSNTVVLSVADGNLSFVGEENLTDYHSPIGHSFGPLLSEVLSRYPGWSYRFDSMPHEVAVIVSQTLESLGAPNRLVEHDAAAVLSLPPTFDSWLGGLVKKERHEVRRKRRRLEDAFGTTTIQRMGPEAVHQFCEMHRTSAGDKGAFMTPEMVNYFADLATGADATIHGLMCDGVIRAAAFGFETDEGYFYYNSAYDIEAASGSPGIVLVASMVEAQIQRGAKIFDFLKGAERYKFKMGAQRRPLYMIEGSLP